VEAARIDQVEYPGTWSLRIRVPRQHRPAPSCLLAVCRQPTRLPRVRIYLRLVAVLAMAPQLTYAHHSFVGFYDQQRIIEIEGIVTSVSWRNPHGTLTVDVADAAGRIEEWRVETGSISVLRIRGLGRDFVGVGDKVRIAGEVALRRSNGLYARNMLLPSGEEALLSIGISPRWTDAETGKLLAAQFDTAVSEDARRTASGIFRVWATVLEDPNSFPMFKGGYPLTAAASRLKAAWDASDVVQLGCLAKGMPALMITPYPIEFVAQGEDILIRFEEDDARRLIHMAPDAAPESGYNSALGYSRGHWEDGTLVVVTEGIEAKYLDSEGTPLSSAARLVERFTPNQDASRLDYGITISDANTFTEPFELRRYWIWRPELEVNEYDCVVAG